MDVEAMQLLNLSPIPELSEMEISTMLEQLDGLSDLNSDLTDQNVEDILKEAEELIDKSSSHKLNKTKTVNDIQNFESDVKSSQIVEKKSSAITSSNLETAEEKNESNVNQPDIISSEHSSPRNTDDIGKHHNSSVTTIDSSKSDNSPSKQNFHPLFSPGNSVNHIKSTIDSLKEYSSLIEKQMSQMQVSSTSTCTSVSKKTAVKKEVSKLNKELTFLNESSTEKSKSSSKSLFKPKELLQKENSSGTFSADNNKSDKVQNCFERLYQERPVRFSKNIKKPKLIEKTPKVLAKKKNLTDLKTSKNPSVSKDKKLVKSFAVKKFGAYQTSKAKGKFIDVSNENDSLFKAWPSDEIDSEKCECCGDVVCSKSVEKENLHRSKDDFQSCSESVQPKVEADKAGTKRHDPKKKLMLLLLQEIKEIKNQIKMTGINSDRTVREEAEVQELAGKKSRPETERIKADSADTMAAKSDGIDRLEEQLSILKSKYEEQIEKLENQNASLKEALKRERKNSEPEKDVGEEKFQKVVPSFVHVGLQTESNVTGNETTPKKSSGSLPEEEIPVPAAVKEASSQTEADRQNASVQCKTPETDKEDPGKKNKMENKENFSTRKKPFNSKPISSDSNVRQSAMKNRIKINSEHENQLMATLRGLQAEVTTKEKENRKLKSEIDLLRTQAKRLSGTTISRRKNEEPKKFHHAGSQTIALGPVPQRPYNPEIYEAGNDELERENEELKVRIKALEDSFGLLKEKRISDLRSLHQVHEKEMARLVSKLETQSSLAKHLHSLLVNR